MTQKRFRKLLRSHGYNRDDIKSYCKKALDFYRNYEIMWEDIQASECYMKKDYFWSSVYFLMAYSDALKTNAPAKGIEFARISYANARSAWTTSNMIYGLNQ